MFPFLAWLYSLPRKGKALVDDCGLRNNAPKREKFNFRLPSVAQKRRQIGSTPAKLAHARKENRTRVSGGIEPTLADILFKIM